MLTYTRRLIGSLTVLAVAVLFSPTAQSLGVFVPTAGLMNTARYGHTATLLGDGQVLIAGGFTGTEFTSDVELYDPTTEMFSSIASMATGRYRHTATRLNDGRVLIVGGVTGSGTATNTTELYNHQTGQFTAGPSMGEARSVHTATLMADGKVMIAGGYTSAGISTTIEIYDPLTDMISPGSITMPTGRFDHTATLLLDGRILIAGGQTSLSSVTHLAEVWAPDASTYQLTLVGMTDPRAGHTATLLSDGRVLVTGGVNSNSADLYDSANLRFDATGAMADIRRNHTASLLSDGQVLVVGGSGLDTAEVYVPGAASFAATASMASPRYLHTATVLTDGQVLVAGGALDEETASNTAELFQVPPAPVADAGADQYLTGNNLGEADVTLTGTATGVGPLGVTWTIDGAQVGTFLTTLVTVGLGTHVAELSVTDALGRTVTDAAMIAVALPQVGPPTGSIPSGTLLLILEGDVEPTDATYLGSYRQVLDATGGPGGQARIVTVRMYRKN